MVAFLPSDKMRVLLVDPDGAPYVLDGIMAATAQFRPSDKARVCLVDENGTPYKATGGGGGGIDLEIVIPGVATLTFTNGILTAVT